MSPLDPLGPILARVRAQALTWKKRGSEEPGEDASEPGTQRGPADLLDGVIASICRIPAEASDRGRKAFQLYLQAVVAREFGIRDVNDPAYQGILERVLASMESDAGLREAMKRAGELLLQRAGAR